MTADERIERLVNRFGQTISDLPTRYCPADRIKATETAAAWTLKSDRIVRVSADCEYICHLCDVIDRMEAALETAALWADCTACGNISAVCGDRCICGENFRTSDGLLEGRHLNFDEPLMPVSTD